MKRHVGEKGEGSFYLFVGCLQILLASSLFIIIILFGFRCALLLLVLKI